MFLRNVKFIVIETEHASFNDKHFRIIDRILLWANLYHIDIK